MNIELHQSTGYLVFYEGGLRRYFHRILCEYFHGPAPSGLDCVNHIDGNKLNNSPENLEWCSRGYNTQHAHEIGLNDVKLEANGRAVLDRHKAAAIRADSRIAREIAADYGVSIPTIYDIKKFRTWNV